jgi:hypothetical protein
MSKWANSLVLDQGPNYALTLAGTPGRVKMHIVKAYTPGDSYATVISNSCGSVAMAAADMPIAANGLARRQTMASKVITLDANSGVSPDLHVVLVDETGTAVLLVTDETTDQVLTAGNTFTVPAWQYNVPQPV